MVGGLSSSAIEMQVIRTAIGLKHVEHGKHPGRVVVM
jgi:hypothetical protein